MSTSHSITACAEHNTAADTKDVVLVIIGVQLEHGGHTGIVDFLCRHAGADVDRKSLAQRRVSHAGDDSRDFTAANVGVRLEIMRVVAAGEHARSIQTVHISGVACRHVHVRNRTVRNVVDRSQGLLRQCVCEDGRKLCSGGRLVVIRISGADNAVLQRVCHIRLVPRTRGLKLGRAADIGAVQTRCQLDRLCDRQVAVWLELGGVYAVHQLVFIRRLNILRVPLGCGYVGELSGRIRCFRGKVFIARKSRRQHADHQRGRCDQTEQSFFHELHSSLLRRGFVD